MLEEVIDGAVGAVLIEEIVETTCREGHNANFEFLGDLEISDAHGALGSFGYGYWIDSIIVFSSMFIVLLLAWFIRYQMLQRLRNKNGIKSNHHINNDNTN